MLTYKLNCLNEKHRLTPSLRGSKMSVDYGDENFCSSLAQRDLIGPRTS